MGKLPQIAALAAKQNRGVYEALRQSGYLRPVNEYLPVSESPAGRMVEEEVSR
jgi:hypothetical protein